MMFGKREFLTAALALAGLMAIPAYAQYGGWYGNRDGGWYGGNRGNWGWQDRDHDRDHDRDDRYNNNGYGYSGSQNRAYQQGYKDGIWDTQHGPQNRSRNWKNDADARAYRDGYNAGYRGNGGYNNNGRWGRGGYGYPNGNYGYGNGGYGYGRGGNYAQQGFIDGQNDGSKDRQTGHSFRPTENPGWRHPDRGYNSGMGISKQQYEQAYRDAYMQGYQRGYYGR